MRREAGAGSAGRLFRTVLLLAAGTAGVALWVAHTRGLPQGVADGLLAAMAGPQCAVETGRVRLRGLQDVEVDGLKVYARGVVGPPGFECDRALIRGDLLRACRGSGCVRELRVNHVILRPAFLRPAPETPSAAAWGEAGQAVGAYRLYAALFDCAGVRVRDVTCEVDPQAERIVARNVTCRVGGGAEAGPSDCRGELVINGAARTVSGRFETAFDPAAAIPILRYYGQEFTCELIGRFAFGPTPPRAEFSFVKPMDARRDLHVDAKLWMENASYRGVDLLSGEATVVIEHSEDRTRVSLSPLVVARPEGTARVDLAVDAGEGLVRFNGTSSVNPRALTQAIGIFTNAWADAVLVEGAYQIESTGVADLRGDSRQFIRTSVKGGRVGVGALVIDDASFTVLTEGATSRVERATGRLYGGLVEGDGAVIAPRAGEAHAFRYRLIGDVKDADFERVVSAARGGAAVEDLSGKLWMRLDVGGPLGTNWLHDVRGRGEVRVRDGRVFRLPVFGGLSGYLARIVPGVDFMLRQSDFSSDFVLDEHRARSTRISIEGGVFSLQGEGSCGFDRSLDVAVQVKLMREDPLIAKVVRLITWPLSKLFEFRLTGTLDAPRWYPVNFSGELLENLGLKNGKDDRGADDSTP